MAISNAAAGASAGAAHPLILGIETSCDETSAAVLEGAHRVRSNVVLSQIPVHQIYGGVVPELASREHLRAVVPIVRQALEQAQCRLDEIAGIAVTQGPGLAGALLVGLTYAKALAWATGIPAVGVNHLEGHIHAVLLEERRQGRPEPEFPALALVVSGGHTSLYEVRPEGAGYAYRILGRTRDDAAGEAYDKVAKLLGLGYPGGPVIDKLSGLGEAAAVPLPRTRLKTDAGGLEFDFSFSGLKTAVLRFVQTQALAEEIEARRNALRGMEKPDLAFWQAHCSQTTLNLIASFQTTVVETLVERTLAAAETAGAVSIFLTGGVAANRQLRQRMSEAAQGLPVLAPAMNLCTDNAAMIAAAGYPRYLAGQRLAMEARAEPQWKL